MQVKTKREKSTMSTLYERSPRSGAWAIAIAGVLLLGAGAATGEDKAAQAVPPKPMRVLLLGNSFTHQAGMPLIIERMAKAGHPGLDFAKLAHGGTGARLQQHWEEPFIVDGVVVPNSPSWNARSPYGVDFLYFATMTPEESRALEDAVAKNPKDDVAKKRLVFYKNFRALPEPRKWDFVSLQSYHDDEGGDNCLYAQYAEKFAKLCQAQGARVVLYETASPLMNNMPLPEPWTRDMSGKFQLNRWNSYSHEQMREKQKFLAALANRLDAAVVPMQTVAQVCHEQRPDITLCYNYDIHPNRAMVYLAACTFYAALFGENPENLPAEGPHTVVPMDADRAKMTAEKNNGIPDESPSLKDREDLQRIAWEGFKRFQELRKTVKPDRAMPTKRSQP